MAESRALMWMLVSVTVPALVLAAWPFLATWMFPYLGHWSWVLSFLLVVPLTVWVGVRLQIKAREVLREDNDG